MGFDIRREDIPIGEYPLSGGISAGITFSTLFRDMSAAIAAGATLDELIRWLAGEYPIDFMALVVEWDRGRRLIHNHQEAAVVKASKRK